MIYLVDTHVLVWLEYGVRDRLVVASALEESATLVAADRKILDWSGLPYKLDASR